MSQTLTYEIALPTSPSPDVTKLVLSIAEVLADGTAMPTISRDVAKDAKSDSVTVREGSSVAISIVAIDDAGNSSAPKSVAFTATDTIPPVLEGDLSVKAVSEQNAVDPVSPVSPVTPPADPTQPTA